MKATLNISKFDQISGVFFYWVFISALWSFVLLIKLCSHAIEVIIKSNTKENQMRCSKN